MGERRETNSISAFVTLKVKNEVTVGQKSCPGTLFLMSALVYRLNIKKIGKESLQGTVHRFTMIIFNFATAVKFKYFFGSDFPRWEIVKRIS